MKQKGVLVFVILLLVAVWAGPGVIAQGDLDVNIEKIVDEGYPTIELVVIPANQSGVPIQGLGVEDFRISDESGPIEEFNVEQFRDEEQGIDIMLVLDVSGSMLDDYEELKGASATLIDTLSPQDRLGLIAFGLQEDGTSVTVAGALNEAREIGVGVDQIKVLNKINTEIEIEELDGTPLYDAIYRGTQLTSKESTNDRRVVIIMTDGVDSDRDGTVDAGSQYYDKNQVVDEIREMDVPVYTVGLGDKIDRAFLQRVANATGAEYLHAPEADELGKLFVGITEMMRQKYDIQFESETDSDGDRHEFTIFVDSHEGSGSQQETYTALFPEEPWIQDVRFALPRQDFRSIDSLENIKGNVTIETDVVARSPIAGVEYLLDGESIGTATEAPWAITWNSVKFATKEPHSFAVRAYDDETPPNENSAYSRPIVVEECSIICQLAQQTDVDEQYVRYIMIGIPVLLILFALLMWLLTRSRKEPDYVPVTVAQAPAPVPDYFVPPPPQPEQVQSANETIGMMVPGAAPFAYGGGTSPKTEILDMRPEHLAYLIDPQTQRMFPLDDPTSIGRDPKNDIVLDDTAVSSEHAKIRLKDGEYVIFDLAATNPVKVNGEVIVRHVLEDGDKLTFGRQLLVYKNVSEGIA